MTQKATVAKVTFGDLTLDCLQFADGSYHFYINQLQRELGIKASNSTGQKYLKPLLEANPKQVSQAKILNTKSIVKTISLDLLAQAIQSYAQLGNKKCLAVAIACVAESLERRADKAFDKKRSEDEYNTRLTARMQGKEARWDLTNAIKAYIDRHQVTGNQAKFLYMHATNTLYCTLTGEPSMHAIKHKYNIPINDTLRNYLSDRDLKHLEYIESLAQRLIDIEDIYPVDAITQATNSLKLGSVGIQRVARI